MAKKWGLITNGATFQALASAIIFFEDPEAALFGRPGKDGGQDARSGDGSRVFQMKHHENQSAATAIRDAKKEASTVATYRKAGHKRHAQWLGVTKWRLVTNAVFNPTDVKRWDDEVVPLFKAQGLDADLWSQEHLDALLDKHPEIHRAFFENETRAFLSVPEMKERVVAQEPFLRRPTLGEFFGRSSAFDTARAFLESDVLFLVIHGAGGVGKTRLLAEIGEDIASEGAWQVLYANVASMSATASWFDGIVKGRPTLLLVDEPEDSDLLKVLAEQFGGRAFKWKIAVTVRSPKDPVLRFLFSPRVKPRVQELAISALPDADAVAMCASLLATGKLGHLPEPQRIEAARELSKRFSRHPIWLTLAVQHLEDHGSLAHIPASAQQLADEYLDEIESNQSEVAPKVIRSLLRWVALAGKVNREDHVSIEQIGKESGVGGIPDVLSRLTSLVKRRVLVQRGANDRIVELKPDVLRDHVLLAWLTKDVGFGTPPIVASDEAKALIESVRVPLVQGTLDRLGRSVLIALARTEFLLDLSGHKVNILGPFFDALVAAVPNLTASQRVALAEVLELVAVPQPLRVVAVVEALRTSQAPDERIEGLFGDRVVRNTDVVLSLAWPLAHAAMGARTNEVKEAVVRELCAVVEAEMNLALKHGLPNDGKRAAALVTRVLEGGPQYWGDFDEIAKRLGLEILDAISRRAPSARDVALLKAIVEAALAVERRQSWNDERSFHVRSFIIGPGHGAWTTRTELLTKVREVIAADATPLESRLALWPVFAEAHRQINYAHAHEPEPKPNKGRYAAELLDDLQWTHDVLVKRGAGAEELGEARAVWDWHRRFETDPILKSASDRLELLYANDELAKEFEPLLSQDDWEQKRPRAKVKAAELAAAASATEIATFVDRGARFIGSDGKFTQLFDVALELGANAESHESIREYVRGTLLEKGTSPRLEFAVVVAGSWVFSVREGGEPEKAAPLVRELLSACGSDAVRVHLLLEIYGRVPRPNGVKDFTPDEHALLRQQRPLFIATGRINEYIAALTATLKHEWPTARAMIAELVESTAVEERSAAIHCLVYSAYWVVRESGSSELPEGLGQWLMEQLLLLPDSAGIGGNDEWHLREILKRVQRPTVHWLPHVLARRQALESQRADDLSRATTHDVRLSKYVEPLTSTSAGDPGAVQAVSDLLNFLDDTGSPGYYLPEVLNDVDPDGLVVPGLVVALVAPATDPERLRRLARIAGAYVTGTQPWEHIAKAVLRAPPVQSEEHQRSIFHALGASDVTTWSGVPGKVPPVFIAAVESSKKSLAATTDAGLRRYWEWRVRRAEAELRDEEQRAKEERGE